MTDAAATAARGDHDDYEHLVRVNDPSEPRAQWLDRAALWDGLWHSLRRGAQGVHDELEGQHGEWLRVRPDPFGPHAGSLLEMRIEEPAEGVLFVRFRYRLVTAAGEPASAPEREVRRAAWRDSDLARIRAIRALPRRPPA